MTPIRVPSDPHLHRWMLFVDGENLAIRAHRFARDKGIALQEGPYYMRDVFVWLPKYKARWRLLSNTEADVAELQHQAIRAYYTSTTGGTDVVGSVKGRLRDIGFHPHVFKKSKTRDKSKGVDIALTTDVLSNAYRDNYDSVVFVAGDGDYVPLVEEVKRLGKVVHVMFFEAEGCGLSPELQLASDEVWLMDEIFMSTWQELEADSNVTR